MSSQVQWLLLLHCADKVARCIVLDIFERYTHPAHILVGIHIHIWIQIARNLFFKPLFVMFFNFVVGFLHRFGEEG